MRLRATRLSSAGNDPRTLLPNLVVASGNPSLSPWYGVFDTTATGQVINFTANALAAREQAISIAGGVAGRTITVAALVSVSSGTRAFRLKNTQGLVVDNFSANLTATTTPQIFALTVTNTSAAGSGLQICGVANNTGGAAGSINLHAFGVFIGSFSAQQIVDRGGIKIT